MSEIDDANEFVEATGTYDDDHEDDMNSKPPSALTVNDVEPQEKKKHGTPVQYSKFSDGYLPTSETIKTLPAGCYNIYDSNSGAYASPALKPSGLLLELPEMKSEEVIKVVDTFWNSEKDYKEGNDFVVGGAAYKAGIMVYGPPGSGKSCTLKLVSNKLVDRGGTVFYADSSPFVVDSFLTQFAKIEKNRKSIIILEDIDSLIQNFGESQYLAMLDSAKSINNVMFIATTNYPDRLDPRIYNRPGRFSHVIKIGLPTVKAREGYLKAILKDHRDVDTIVKESEGFTIDHLTALINAVYREKKDLKNELKRLRALFKIPSVSEGLERVGI